MEVLGNKEKCAGNNSRVVSVKTAAYSRHKCRYPQDVMSTWGYFEIFYRIKRFISFCLHDTIMTYSKKLAYLTNFYLL